LQLSENTTHFAICRIERDVSSARRVRWGPGVLGSIVYIIQTVQGRIQDETLWHPYLYFPGRGRSAFNELISFIMLAEKCNSESLCNRLEYQVLSKAFSISKKTAAVHVLLLKRRITWAASLIY